MTRATRTAEYTGATTLCLYLSLLTRGADLVRLLMGAIGRLVHPVGFPRSRD